MAWNASGVLAVASIPQPGQVVLVVKCMEIIDPPRATETLLDVSLASTKSLPNKLRSMVERKTSMNVRVYVQKAACTSSTSN